MKYLSVLTYVIFSSVVWQVFIFQPNAIAEEGSLAEAIDCTEVDILYTEDSTLTREERLRLMDKAFFESLNRFELCQKAREEKAKEGAGSNGGAGGSEGSGGGAGTASSVESVASSTMSGTEVAAENSSAKDTQTAESGALPGSQEMENIDEAGSSTTGAMRMSNGKIPEDIPPAKNDDALAAQIRYAAENEPDPVKSAQLWNEYRKYKGLAPKK